ncbi:DUF4138 domain-containing protein [Pedobacter sp. Leaf250]|uniref:DUF4138 domain-containing protein n=1 Tax=Pedobacter sp. Leaf250 TaxID=2876559 RepID=UPI00121E671F|nr:DUF4138 domain-containing protein [Pedobacter sp. Leaf250]RZJ90912.1 MAG: DUF4138 domain-containing protein [Chryseobacterium sp.]
MKNFKIFLPASLILFSGYIHAQNRPSLPVLLLSPSSSVHLRSPEPISYVDLPRGFLNGDLPLKNLLRLRLDSGFLPSGGNKEIGILTLTGEHFLAQYRVVYADSPSLIHQTELEVLPKDMVPLLPSDHSLSTPQIKQKALTLLSARINKPLLSGYSQGIGLKLNQIASAGDLIFLDLTFSNESRIGYEIQQVSFSVEDKKVSRSANFQQFALLPKFILNDADHFDNRYRNIYVLPKAVFSSSKQLLITVSEKQPSSRQVSLALSYGKLLQADSF